jgi:hypothetical protein
MVKNTRAAVNTAIAIASHLIHRESSTRKTYRTNRLLPKSVSGGTLSRRQFIDAVCAILRDFVVAV